MSEPEQRPLGDDLGRRMHGLRAAADRAIAAAVEAQAAGRPDEEAFREGAAAVLRAMPPVFGPANAWLFNERDGKLDALQQALGLRDAAWCRRVREELTGG